MFRTFRFALLVGALLMLCASAALAYTYSSRQKADLHWINTVRASHHAKPALHLGAKMTKRAQAWANHLAKANLMEEDDVVGYKVCFKSGGYNYGANSAISRGAKNNFLTDQSALLHSPPHLRNIIDRHFQWVGIGIARDKHGLIVVQDFCGK